MRFFSVRCSTAAHPSWSKFILTFTGNQDESLYFSLWIETLWASEQYLVQEDAFLLQTATNHFISFPPSLSADVVSNRVSNGAVIQNCIHSVCVFVCC